jgi:hypothetical protein
MSHSLPCKGCRHLVNASRDVCKAVDVYPRLVENQYTGRMEYPPGGLHLRPTVVEMRAEGGQCGPARSLYQPNWFARLRARIRTEP